MLFGQQNDDVNQAIPVVPMAPSMGVNPLAVDPATGASLPVAPPDPQPVVPTDLTEPSVLNQPTSSPFGSVPENLNVAAPAAEPTMPFAQEPAPAPSLESPEAPAEPAPFSAPAEPAPEPASDDSAADPTADSLLALKQQALAQLSPLVDQLDQTPEERFRTTMMMIQSTDNQSLIQNAYDAAQQITDEKVRAQALLDVINEINYFTQQPAN